MKIHFHKTPHFFLLSLLLIFTCLSYLFIDLALRKKSFAQVCYLVDTLYYRDDEEMRSWLDTCRVMADEVEWWESTEEIGSRLKDLMATVMDSHFSLMTPSIEQRWVVGKVEETGFRARFVEDRIIVYSVLEHSPAESAGMKLGDELIRVSPNEVNSLDDLPYLAGDFTIRRKGQLLKLHLQPTEFYVDDSPKIRQLDRKTAYLEIPNFNERFFERRIWQDFYRKWLDYPQLIIDLRNNEGGNFIAMLRALSVFRCHGELVGRVDQPRRKDLSSHVAFDDTSAIVTGILLERFRAIDLYAFEGYDCYKGKVEVLIGPRSSSAAEIFTDAMKRRAQTRVLGWRTAGSVLISTWADLSSLGENYFLSIPYATFENADGHSLEGEGVEPHKYIYDDLSVWLSGEDSWIKSAYEDLSQW